MPFVALERPSLALGLLQSSARAAGVSARSVYPAFGLAESIGAELYSRLHHSAPDQNLGDWVFAGAAFPGEDARHTAFLDLLDRPRVADWLWLDPDELDMTLWRVREDAEALVVETAREIVDSGARIVGCTSVFAQQVASLALLRTVKDLDPTIVTMLGGANCEADMGRAVHRSFAWVDFVVSGEADLFFGGLCATILRLPDGGRSLADLPTGTLGPAHRSLSGRARASSAGRASVPDLDATPIPDFTDYFTALSGSRLREDIIPALLVETSRGCWWGEKHHCTFCGLNGDEMAYRPKSAARVLEEFATLVDRYGTNRLLVVDNILHRGHLDTVIPALIEAGAPYSIFYETKANLTATQIERLSDAGVRRVQPGFESLHRGALELFDKGNTPVMNLRYLKTARALGTFVTWNFLWEIPGEEWSWYASVADWIPLVTHLQPPNTLCALRFDRFSLYHARPEEYGLILTPTAGLGFIYPVDAATLNDLAYYFTDASRPVELALRRLDPGNRRLEAELDRWMTLWDRVRRADADAPAVPKLEAWPTAAGLEIVDTRPIAPEPRVRLTGLDAEVLSACDGAPSRAGLLRRLRETGVEADERVIDETIERLIARALILDLDEHLVGLPTAVQTRPYISVEEYPGGTFAPDWRAHHPARRAAMRATPNVAGGHDSVTQLTTA
jgi:ribosomal peptide maturation radical SAM protein 1